MSSTFCPNAESVVMKQLAKANAIAILTFIVFSPLFDTMCLFQGFLD